jgi:hypothetical protein
VGKCQLEVQKFLVEATKNVVDVHQNEYSQHLIPALIISYPSWFVRCVGALLCSRWCLE